MRKPVEIDSDDYGPVIARAAVIDVAKATGMVCTRMLLRDGLSRASFRPEVFPYEVPDTGRLVRANTSANARSVIPLAVIDAQ
jgi:hypothetical protein